MLGNLTNQIQRFLGGPKNDLSRPQSEYSETTKCDQTEVIVIPDDDDLGLLSSYIEEDPSKQKQLLKMYHSLSCPLCLTVLVPQCDPRQLVCGHVYCSGCIKEFPVVDDCVNCVLCRRKSSFKELKSAEQVQNQAQQLSNSILTCGECERSQTDFYCPQCNSYTCASCTHRMHSGKGTSRHVLVPFELNWEQPEVENLDCKVHPKVKASVMCRECEHLLCFECGLTHRGHEMDLIENVSESLKRKMKSLRQSMRSEQIKLCVARVLLQRQVQLLDLNHKDSKQSLKQRFDGIRLILDRTQQAMILSMDDQVANKKATLQRQEQRLGLTDADLRLQSKASRVCSQNGTSDAFVLNSGQEIVKSMQSVLDNMPPLQSEATIKVEISLENLQQLLNSLAVQLPQTETALGGQQRRQSQLQHQGRKRHSESPLMSPKRLRHSEMVHEQRRVSSVVDPEEWKRRVLNSYIDSSYLTLTPKNWEIVYAGHQNILDQRYERLAVGGAVAQWQHGTFKGLPVLTGSSGPSRSITVTKDHVAIVNSTRSAVVFISREQPAVRSMQRLIGIPSESQTKELQSEMCSSAFLLPSVNPLANNSAPALATGHKDGSVRYWNWHAGEDGKSPSFTCTICVQGHDKPVAYLNGYDTCFASATLDGQLVVWKFASGQRDRICLQEVFKDHSQLGNVDLKVEFIKSSSLGFFVGLNDGQVALLSAAARLHHVFSEPEDTVARARMEQVSSEPYQAIPHAKAAQRPWSPRSQVVRSKCCCAVSKRFLFVSSVYDPYSICVYDVQAALEGARVPSNGASIGFLYRLSAHDLVSHPAHLKSLQLSASGLILLANFSDDAEDKQQFVMWTFDAEGQRPLVIENVKLQQQGSSVNDNVCYGWILKQQLMEDGSVNDIFCKIMK